MPISPLFFLLLLFFSSISAEPWRRHTVDPSDRGLGKKGADGVRLLDFNRDGRLDVVTGWENGDAVRVCYHPGLEGITEPWPAVTVGKERDVEDAVGADLDGDGRPEVISCAEGKTKRVAIFWSENDGSWKKQILSGTEGLSWMFCVPLQIDGKNGLDLVLGSKGKGASVSWLQAPENPRTGVWKLRRLTDASWIMSLLAADMDGDGDQDLVLTNRKGADSGVYWLENPGPEKSMTEPAWKRHLIGGRGREVMFLKLVDIDPVIGDESSREIVVAVKDDEVHIFRRPDDPTQPWSATAISTATPGRFGRAKAVAVGDLDLDGHMDVVMSCESATPPLQGIYIGDLAKAQSEKRQPHWRGISGPEGVKYDRLELLDLDEDGDLDILTCEESAALGVFWHENPVR